MKGKYSMSNNDAKIIYPLDQRTPEEQKKRVDGWLTWGLLHPDLMDRLVSLNQNEIESLKTVMATGSDLSDMMENIKNFIIIKGIVTGELDVSFDE